MDSPGVYAPSPTEKPAQPPARKKGRWTLILAVVLLVILIGLGVLRYFGPNLVTKGFMDAAFSNNARNAVGYLCPSAQQASPLNSAIPPGFTIDTSGLAYDVQSESLSNATVHVHGTISAAQVSVKFDYTVALQTSGVWWCISQITANSTS